jgi:hypothetical protein
LVSRLLKSVWESSDEVYLIGAQHFDLSIQEVREKLAEISGMRDVIAKDLWDSTDSAHAQIIDINNGNHYAKQVGTLLLTASLSTAVNSIKGLTVSEMLECLIEPNHQASAYRTAFTELEGSVWYMHKTQEERRYFSHQENLTKKLQGYADKAPQNKVDDLIRYRLEEMYKPVTKEAYEKVLPLPEMDEAEAVLKTVRALLMISPDGKTPPGVVVNFFKGLVNKNNVLILTGDKTSIASVEKAARHVYAVTKADNEIPASHPLRKELDEKKAQYEQDFQTTVLSVFDKLLFPGNNRKEDVLRPKALDRTYPSNEPYNGERQVVKTLTSDPIKLYTQVSENFDALRARAESLLFGAQDEARKTDLLDKMKQRTQMPWLPSRGFDQLAIEAYQCGAWEDLGNGYITKKPKPKTTQVIISEDSSPDDAGTVRLKIDVANAGNSPRIHYVEDDDVTENSPVLSDNSLATKALRVQFLAVDPTGKNVTGSPTTWQNHLSIRNRFEEIARTVELFVAPKGSIRYTLDGSEPRNGVKYKGPIQLGDEETIVYVFAESEGLEEKRNFTFAKSGTTKIPLKVSEPAILYSPSPKRLDSSSKTYEGLKMAKDKNIEFEQVMLMVGSAPKAINLSLGEIRMGAEFLEKELEHLQSILSPDVPVVMTFKKIYTATGYDLEQFTKQFGIEIGNGEVEQK